jgi:hypothetical protein
MMAKTLTLRLDDFQEQELLSLMEYLELKTGSKALSYVLKNYINESNKLELSRNELDKAELRIKHLQEVMLRSRNVCNLFLESVSQDELF